MSQRSFQLSAILAVTSLAVECDAQCDRYVIQVVQPPCTFGIAFIATGIGDDDRLCGYYTCGASIDDQPFVWKDGVLTTISLPAATPRGRAQDVNCSGHVTGYMETLTSGGRRAFVYANGTVTDLGVFPNDTASEGLGINERAVACGYSYNTSTGPFRAYFWEGQIQELLLWNSQANDINEMNQMCGRMGPSPAPHAFIWQDGKVLDIGTIPGGTTGNAVAINNKGEVLVQGLTAGPNPVTRSFLWRNGRWIDLGVLPGNVRCFAQAINDNSEIVGYCSHPTTLLPFIWRDGIMTSLRDLIPPDSPYLLSIARGINNSGKIAATASLSGGSYAVMLSPVPGLPGDVNCDNIIGISDLLWVIGRWGPDGGGTIADLNSDGTVNIHDLLLVITNWNAA